jgi:lipopolysaccharide export LptBFGC system permease protein LptF
MNDKDAKTEAPLPDDRLADDFQLALESIEYWKKENNELRNSAATWKAVAFVLVLILFFIVAHHFGLRFSNQDPTNP